MENPPHNSLSGRRRRRFNAAMARAHRLPIALTIAGSDSGGGAGIQADLKTFAALGVHGASAVTCLTAQNPCRILGLQPAPPKIVRQQIEAVFAELPPAAVKTGMLYSAEIIRTVARCLRGTRRPPLVVDPVMISTSGRRLLERSAVAALTERLLPLVTLITPNLLEAEVLTGMTLRSPEDLRRAARELRRRFGCAALVKGGHLRGGSEAVDVFYDGATELMLSAPLVQGVRTHGTGCTYSAAITAHLARGFALPKAVELAKVHITGAIAHSQRVARYRVLNCFWARRR